MALASPNCRALLGLTVTPNRLMMPDAGTITQHVNFRVQVGPQRIFPTTYTIYFVVSLLGNMVSNPLPFTVLVQ